MRKAILFHFILLFILAANRSGVLYAQPDSVPVYHLDDAIVKSVRKVGVSDMQRFSAGGSTYRSDSTSLAVLRHTSLANYITQLTPVYIRESGNGMMATVSLRGTSASHTSVQWNGLAINSLTMGQTDFSHLPVFFFDGVEIHPGGEGALYGNGAVGGSIVMQTTAERKEGIHTDLQQNIGSFGYTFSGGKLLVNRKLWSSKTAVMYNYCKNDFPFRNRSEAGFPNERQNNASYNKYGILQEFYYRPSDRSSLSLKAWYMNFYREIQPMMSQNADRSAYDTIRDCNLVTLLSYNHNASWAKFSLTGAYLYDKQRFRNDIIATNRFAVRAEGEKNILKPLIAKVGTYVEYIVPDVYSYKSGVTEWRGDVYALFGYRIAQRWEANINLRQIFVTNLTPTFVPSAGVGYKLIDGVSNQLKLRTTLSKSYRAPTLNDRYWKNPGESASISDLEPEAGVNIEGGCNYVFSSALLNIEAQTTAYHNVVDNWIQWLPRGRIWKPANLKKVDVTGVEVGAKISLSTSDWKFTASGNYAYAYSKVSQGKDDIVNTTVGKQLPLMPKQRWNALLAAAYYKAFIQFALNYTGETYSTDYNMWVHDYTLASLSAGYNFVFGETKQALVLQVRVDNLFDKEYQNVMFYAMPGRNWNVSLRYVF